MKNKLLFFAFIFCVSNVNVFAQVRSGNVDGGNDEALLNNESFKPKFSLGVGAGVANMYGDFSNSIPSPVLRLGVGTRLTPSFIVGIEGYFGQLSSSMPVNKWTNTGFNEATNFQAVDINGKISLDNFIENANTFWLKLLSGLYFGGGFGLINAKVATFTGKFAPQYTEQNKNLASGAYTKDGAFTQYIPINIGLRVHLKRFFGSENTQIMFNYQINYTYSDYIDGWKFATSTSRNQFNDCYTVLSVGLSFRLTKD